MASRYILKKVGRGKVFQRIFGRYYHGELLAIWAKQVWSVSRRETLKRSGQCRWHDANKADIIQIAALSIIESMQSYGHSNESAYAAALKAVGRAEYAACSKRVKDSGKHGAPVEIDRQVCYDYVVANAGKGEYIKQAAAAILWERKYTCDTPAKSRAKKKAIALLAYAIKNHIWELQSVDCACYLYERAKTEQDAEKLRPYVSAARKMALEMAADLLNAEKVKTICIYESWQERRDRHMYAYINALYIEQEKLTALLNALNDNSKVGVIYEYYDSYKEARNATEILRMFK